MGDDLHNDGALRTCRITREIVLPSTVRDASTALHVAKTGAGKDDRSLYGQKLHGTIGA